MKKQFFLLCVILSVSFKTHAQQEENSNDNRLATKSLLASAQTETSFHPAPGLSPDALETAVNEKNPYALYRKGSIAEYCFQSKGKPTKWYGVSTYLQQIVVDEKIENGLLVAYVKQAFFNKKHEPSKGIAASYKDYVFPTEIDTAGTCHLIHNFMQDVYFISKRRGYGVVIPNDMKPGMRLQSNTIYDNSKGAFGGLIKIETAYSDWQVVGEQKITTPAGTFDCIKLTGRIAQKQGEDGKFYGQQIACWMSRGIGIVQYETIYDSDKKHEPFVVYLNRLDLK